MRITQQNFYQNQNQDRDGTGTSGKNLSGPGLGPEKSDFADP
jgi:hypothetical protein